ncbi:MAG TPA: WD40 repeat domain-containing protein [Polyangiaceae bacterium]|nr:WD40 repeat domain-containing protein [Polyangiaceae bacterium]
MHDLHDSRHNTVAVWDFRGKGPEGTQPIQLQAHHGVCTKLAFSPHTGVLASGSQDTTVVLWQPRKHARPVQFAFLSDEVTALEWHPEHETLFGADASGSIVAWPVS